eukprot:3703008-Prymnesium_polylepis.1
MWIVRISGAWTCPCPDVCGFVRTGPDLSIETAWICPDMLVLTPICLRQHLSLTQGFRSNVTTGTL